MSTQIARSNAPDVGKVALKFFFNVTDKWGCTPAQQQVLLGSVGKTTYYRYRRLGPVRLPHDTLERVSYLMGIYKALGIIFSGHPESAWDWVKRPNAAAPFNGRSALDYMLAGRVVDLADVRRYLEAQLDL